MARKIYIAEFEVSNGRGAESDLPRLVAFADYLSAMVMQKEKVEGDEPYSVKPEVVVTGRRRVEG